MKQTQQVVQMTSNPRAESRVAQYGLFTAEEPAHYVELYRLRDVTAEEAQALGFTNTAEGIYIEYPNPKDSRIRYNRTGFQAQQDLGKYGQRPGTLPAAYVPPTIAPHHVADQTIPILITEGEFKAIVLDHVINEGLQKPAIIPIALAGVWSWKSTKTGIETLPIFEHIKNSRQVLIAYDMDNPVNPQVQKALEQLSNKLYERTREVKVLTWPSAEGKGIDDYLAGKPGPQEALKALFTKAQSPAHVVQVLKMNDSYVYDKIQDAVYDFNTAGYVKPQAFKSHYFTETFSINVTRGGQQVPKQVPKGEYWLTSAARAQAEGKTFAPGQPRLVAMHGREAKQINTWTAWGAGSDLRNLKPVKGDVEPFIEYITATFKQNKLAPNAPCVDPVQYLIQRLAWIFQHPTEKHPTWIYLIGKPLQGKSKLINIITRLIGDKYTSHIDEAALGSSFSGWRSEKLLIAFDDVAIVERNRIKQVLKRMSTERSTMVNNKYEKEYTAATFETFFFATNSLDPLLDHDDRRALVLEAACPWTKEEWSRFDKWANLPASYNALLHYLMFEVTIEASFLNLRPPITHMRELVAESAESGWDEVLNMLAAPLPLQWLSPASQEVRKFRPTVMTPEMLKALYLIIQGPQEQKHEIKSATLTAKLQRFGASRLHPSCAADARGRVFFKGKQTTLWGWEAQWAGRTTAEYFDELRSIEAKYPELFAGYAIGAPRF